MNTYKNHETFLVANYLDGNYGENASRQCLGLVRKAAQPGESDPIHAVAKVLKHWVESRTLLEENTLAGDLVAAALENVDWRELAEDKLSEIE